MPLQIEIDRSNYDDHIEIENEFTAEPGLSESLIRFISEQKKEPEWMLKKRLQGLELFNKTPLPKWGPSLTALDLNKIVYYVKPGMKEAARWEDLPEEIRKTAERIGIPEAEKHSLSGAGFQFDCLTEDSLVHTNPRGPVEIKDIKPGDIVFSYDEDNNEIVKSKVIGVLDKGKLPVFEVKVAGRTIRATSNHPFLTLIDNRKEGRQRARYAKEWKSLNELKVGDVVAIATDLPDCGESYKFPQLEIHRIIKGKNQTGNSYDVDISKTYNNISLPKESNEDMMWILGLFLGDGWISKSKREFKKYVKFAIPKSQHSLREELINACKRVFGSRVLTSTKNWISINSTILAHFIEEVGFEGTASTKKVPDWIMAIPKNEKLAFLGGYLDSDGTVRNGKKSKDVVYTSVNEKILEKVKQICFYCGLQTSKVTTISTSYHYKGKTEKKILHRLHVSGNTLIIKSRYEFKRERLENKKQYSKFRSILETNIKAHTSNSVGLAKIESILPTGIQHVYDLAVENYRNFVAEGIVVHNSDMAYHNLKKEWEDQGVIFENMDVAVKKYPELVKKYFMTSCIPINDHKFIMLHAAVWSGGTFIYIPKHIKVELPLQAYFRMNEEAGGQFEHTLIIVDEGAELHYIEGCFTKGNKVITNPDYKPIEEINVKDKVLTHDGTYKEVKEVHKRSFTGSIKKIKLYGDSITDIEVTWDHPFLYVDKEKKRDRNKNWDPRWNIPKFFKERDYIEEVKRLLKNVFGIDKIHEFTHKTNNGTSVVVCSTELCRIFEQFGKKADKKEITHWMMLVVPEKQKELIKSYFYGDGNYYNQRSKKTNGLKEVFRINSVSERLMTQGRDILLRLGIAAFINKRDRSKEN